ncbi:DUF433 domain-containing protein [Aurantimonas sp. VKM B-3413]|uniref:DUF433 domain-containing protein n=1 Tax=Aurantimonas sp. VKM B-3413 TaxID=2779401 RepID=UPI0021026A93|nr:DUF433 domain-containing protein [Aurantimonas sp. VKM B-3413]MCB8839577.1 DUF433 domain-containing protein [Aurantimonas sp. VKM B-3413]
MPADSYRDRIVTDPEVMFGKPTIKGTRLTVEHVLRRLAAGWSVEDLLHEHPRLTREDVMAASAIAADHLHDAFPAAADAAE